MMQWPVAFDRFLERPVPIYIHIAAAGEGRPPFGCRGYTARFDAEGGLVRIGILKSQWIRLQACMRQHTALAALLTCGIDNESYQVKGELERQEDLNARDRSFLEAQIRLTSRHFPDYAPLISVNPADCVSIGIRAQAVYQQTPGPDAGVLLYEREG
ncbi:hypothetical protein [Cohnella terricola]|uniref:Pyridoxamine 5'-phosphate oxidase putative domain-containing protein n=1 Tax=Cohnella terricola TaxID=1289167 RepID=A0A559J7D0_9BACL|nr:hypothetical protein [Cohnella terricola]TVX95795.1 hypothetical protein FPZ45_22625 [Cohnella terricola]